MRSYGGGMMIVGQAPSRTSELPLDGRCGRRLCELMGLEDWDELTACFAVGNLLPCWPGKDGKGDGFPLERARESARSLVEEVLVPEGWWLVLMLGWNVARAFGVSPRVGYLRPFMMDAPAHDGFGLSPLEGVVVPHPSGVNRWYNEAANVRRARRYLRSLV